MHGNSAYDTTGFEDLLYASTAMGYAAESSTERPRSHEASNTGNTGNGYGARTSLSASDAQAQYQQTYTQPSMKTALSAQYNAYSQQIARPASTDSTASRSSQRQTPVQNQQNLQNSRTNAQRTSAPFSQQQAGMQTAKPDPQQASNGYAPRQSPQMNQKLMPDSIAQAARAYAQQQAYCQAQKTILNSANPGTSFPQRSNAASPTHMQASDIFNQQPVEVSNQRQTTTTNQRGPRVHSNLSQPPSPFLQGQLLAASASHQAVSGSNPVVACPMYRTSNAVTQGAQPTRSNTTQQSTDFNQRQPQTAKRQATPNQSQPNTPRLSINQPVRQSLPASHQSSNPRSLLSPTEASAHAYQSRNGMAFNRQEETQQPQMQTLIDPRDLDLRPRPSASDILGAAKLMREAEERQKAEAAAKAAVDAAAKAKEQTQQTVRDRGQENAQGVQTAENPSIVPHSSPTTQPHKASNVANDSVPILAKPPASKGSEQPLKPVTSAGPSQPADLPQVPKKMIPTDKTPTPVTTAQSSVPKRNTVVWPEDKKAYLTVATIDEVNSVPENFDKTITKEQIRTMLDENRAFIELCAILEGMKFRIDRKRLARRMLTAVSDTNAAQPTTEAGNSQQSEEQQPTKTQVQPPTDPQILGQPRAVVSMAEPSVGPDGKRQVQGRPLNTVNTLRPTNVGKDEEAPKKRSHRKSAPPEIGPDGQPIPRRGRGRPRRDGLPPIPRKSMSALQSAEKARGSPSTINESKLSAFTYQPPHSNQGPPPLSIDQPRSPLRNLQSRLGGAATEDWRSRHAAALKDTYESMDDRPQNFPYPATEASAGPASDEGIEHHLRAALDNGPDSVVSRNHTLSHQGTPVQDFPIREVSAVAATPSSSHKRNATDKTPPNSTMHAQQPHNHHTQQEKPLAKEMAARKRRFSDLIDLTEDSDDDRSGPSKFPKRVENTRAPLMAGYPNVYGAPHDPIARFGNLEPHLHEGHGHPIPVSYQPQALPNAGPHIAPGFNVNQHDRFRSSSAQISSRNSPNPSDHFEDLCKPIDKNLALRKSGYNPKTIARDVLITGNRHPTQRGLNAHLEILKKKFPKHVNHKSDLSTFRWDLVDPGGLPVGSANMPTNEEPKSQKALDKASQLLTKVPRPTLGEPNPPSNFQTPYARPPSDTSSVFKRPAIPVNTTPIRPSHLRNESSGPSFAISPSPRRGRPPKDRFGEPSKSSSSLREVSTSNAPPKKRGRPFKSEESALKAKIRQQRLSTGELQPGRRGRPRKSVPVPSKVHDPKYITFDCEWRDCKAELQNLETLRQHIVTVHAHAQPSGAMSCQWINCGKMETVKDSETNETKTVHHDHMLSDLDHFKKHVEKNHMPAYAWHLGDGPKGSDLDGNESDVSYLSRNGKQVTPSIADQEVVDDHKRPSSDSSPVIIVNKNGAPRKRVGRPPKNKAVEQPGNENAVNNASKDSRVDAGSTS